MKKLQSALSFVKFIFILFAIGCFITLPDWQLMSYSGCKSFLHHQGTLIESLDQDNPKNSYIIWEDSNNSLSPEESRALHKLTYHYVVYYKKGLDITKVF